MLYSLATNEDKAGYAANASRFSDVGEGRWFSAAVGFLTAAEVVVGYPDGTFGGGRAITRAEFAAIMSRLVENGADDGIPSDTGADLDGMPFADAQSHWARDHILAAYRSGWAQGYPDGTFRPDADITRAEAVAIVNRAIGRDRSLYEGYTMKFSDVPQRAWHFLDIVAASNDKG